MSRHGFSIPSWGRRWRRRWAAPSGTLRIARPPVSCMRTGRQRPAGDGWVLARLREAAAAALETGAPQAAAGLLARALAEPPPPDQRVECLREAARAEATAGRDTAGGRLEQALSLAADPRQRLEIALQLADVYAVLNRRAEAVDVLERVLAELGEADAALAARLASALVLSG